MEWDLQSVAGAGSSSIPALLPPLPADKLPADPQNGKPKPPPAESASRDTSAAVISARCRIRVVEANEKGMKLAFRVAMQDAVLPEQVFEVPAWPADAGGEADTEAGTDAAARSQTLAVGEKPVTVRQRSGKAQFRGALHAVATGVSSDIPLGLVFFRVGSVQCVLVGCGVGPPPAFPLDAAPVMALPADANPKPEESAK